MSIFGSRTYSRLFCGSPKANGKEFCGAGLWHPFYSPVSISFNSAKRRLACHLPNCILFIE